MGIHAEEDKKAADGLVAPGLSREEKSLLLFFEDGLVNNAGKLAGAHMNEADVKIAERWAKRGFIEFGRIPARAINGNSTHWVVLSEAAWHLASQERKARAERNRMYGKDKKAAATAKDEPEDDGEAD